MCNGRRKPLNIFCFFFFFCKNADKNWKAGNSNQFKNYCPDGFATIQKAIGEWNEFDWSNRRDREESINETDVQVRSELSDATPARRIMLKVATARNSQEIAKAIRFALIKAAEKGWKEIQIEANNKMVIEMIKERLLQT
ncbi:hypothetical protein ACH5RR_039390 [Cinchona calisaya]|uniref:RNase H type-1 domain-containing protein n=1 Tax=Cinchona calisaya TaxID=153742 RepID=A0ABD2Y377_9GENT